MKNCPTCKRTYQDDTLAFCLDDGALLSAPYDPHSTSRGHGGRGTDPSRTEVLPPELAPTSLHSTITAVTPLAYSQGGRQSPVIEKRSGKHWILLSGALAFVVVGLVIVLGYLAWKANNKPIPEPSGLSSSAPTNSNDPVNAKIDVQVNANKDAPVSANKDTESSLTDETSSRWLDGAWEGEGYQSDTKTTWAVRLAVQDGSYAIDYPNIPCRGIWTLVNRNTTEASFIESITEGADRCANNSRVMIQKVNDSEISCKYTHSRSRVVIATVVLSRKAQSTQKR
jgi:hypothetical protein